MGCELLLLLFVVELEAPSVARVLPLACANEHLLRRSDSLVAVYIDVNKNAKQKYKLI